jgi:hypothetical protein
MGNFNFATMEIHKEHLEGIVSDYFNSINNLFAYRQRNSWKFTLTRFLFVLSIIYFVVNALPYLPWILDHYFESIYLYIKQSIPFLKEYNFWTRWGLGIVISIIIMGVIYPFYKYWDIKEKKRAIDIELLHFCYVYSFRKEIKTYLINGLQEHLLRASKYYNSIIDHQLVVTAFSEKSPRMYLFEALDKIKKQFPWIKLSDESSRVLSALTSIPNKFGGRLEQKKDLEVLLPAIDYLTFLEFAKIKPEIKISPDQTFENINNDLFFLFISEVERISAIEPRNKVKIASSDKIKVLLNNIGNLFISRNMIVCFLSWLVLLGVLFEPIAMLFINITQIKLDSTLIIGFLTVPFIGAATIAASIYNKSKN